MPAISDNEVEEPPEVTAMKNSLQLAVLFGLIGLLTSPALAADTRFAVKAERAGIQQIFGIIDQVSLKQADVNTTESLKDVLEMKNQLHSAQANNTASTSGAKAKRLPPARRTPRSF